MVSQVGSALTGMSCAVVLAGCAAFDTPVPKLAEPEHNRAVLVIYRHDPNMPKQQNGWAYFDRRVDKLWLPDDIDVCYISTRNYPRELGHEVAHCFNGDFHGTPDSDHFKYSIWR